jgi:hypothetical protein
MLFAQLRHKVPLQFEGMEDVLTSSIFALLRYLPPSAACELLSRWADVPIPSDPPDVIFWPRYDTPAGFGIFLGAAEDEARDRGRTEPDVVIRNDEWLVLVEVKYRSHLDPAFDQLGREFAIGYRLAEEEERRFRLLAVTADVLPPRPGGVELAAGTQRALGQVRERGGGVTEEMIGAVPDALRWIGWQRVYGTLSRAAARGEVADHGRRLLEDACKLLALRGLRPYTNVPLRRAMVRWTRAEIPPRAWRSPVAYRYEGAVSP